MVQIQNIGDLSIPSRHLSTLEKLRAKYPSDSSTTGSGGGSDAAGLLSWLHATLTNGENSWTSNQELVQELKEPVSRSLLLLCMSYNVCL